MKWNNLFGKRRTNFDGPQDHPEKRVETFILHWHQQWLGAKKKMKGKVDFDYWASLIGIVDAQHFAEGSNSGSANSFSSVADHDPDRESITRCNIDGSTAQVETESQKENSDSLDYRIYTLHQVDGGNWLITEILLLFHPPHEPVIDTAKHEGIMALSSPDTPLEPPDDNLRLDENMLFRGGRTVSIPNADPATTELRSVGEFQTTSGVLGILDFGYDIYEYEPLDRSVQPGAYPVEVVRVLDRVAGIRIRFDADRSASKWFSAKTKSGNGVYGVDAGNLAVFDVQNLMQLSRLEKEHLYSDWIRSCEPEILSMTGKNDCVITPSGFGDGAYPALWGVSDNNEVVSLFIDFMILVEENEDGVFTSL